MSAICPGVIASNCSTVTAAGSGISTGTTGAGAGAGAGVGAGSGTGAGAGAGAGAEPPPEDPPPDGGAGGAGAVILKLTDCDPSVKVALSGDVALTVHVPAPEKVSTAVVSLTAQFAEGVEPSSEME